MTRRLTGFGEGDGVFWTGVVARVDRRGVCGADGGLGCFVGVVGGVWKTFLPGPFTNHG